MRLYMTLIVMLLKVMDFAMMKPTLSCAIMMKVIVVIHILIAVCVPIAFASLNISPPKITWNILSLVLLMGNYPRLVMEMEIVI